jgi:hypothetical protein
MTTALAAADQEVRDILQQAKRLAVRYRELTGKPLGVTGEIAELAAADWLGCILSSARTPGFDALWTIDGVEHRLQIKGRVVSRKNPYRGRCPSIIGDAFDRVSLVLLDKQTLDVIEIWVATAEDVMARLDAPGGKARNIRRAMGIAQFKSISYRIVPESALDDRTNMHVQ